MFTQSQKRCRHIWKKVFAICLLAAYIPMLSVGFILLNSMSDALTEATSRNAEQMLHQASETIQQQITTLNTALWSIVIDDNLFDSIKEVSAGKRTALEVQGEITENLMQIKSLHDSIAAITFVVGNSNYMFSSAEDQIDYDTLLNQDWMKTFITSGRTLTYTGIHSCNYLSRVNTNTFTILQRIQPERNNYLTYTYMVVEVKAANILQLFRNMLTEDISIYLTDANGEICYTFQGNTDFTGENYLTFEEKIDVLNWTAVLHIAQSVLLKNVMSVRNSFKVLLLIVTFFVVILTSTLSHHITKPIRQLSEATRKVREGNLDVQIVTTTQDEIGQARDDFNAMVVTLRKLLQDIKKEERQRYNAEIQALQAQINPHFLYNTLNVIRWLSMMNENEKINSMIISLVKLLEYTREDLSVFVPIEREIEHVRKYVQVMSIRYDGKFQFIEELDSELLQMYTIRFVLQPLVENAIFHGIDPSESKGVIMLKIHRIENRITFSVSDDGVGFDIEKNRHRFFSGYGITNVNDRLRRQFGSQSMIQVFSEVGKGTWVEFSIPCITEIPQEDDNDDTIAHC